MGATSIVLLQHRLDPEHTGRGMWVVVVLCVSRGGVGVTVMND
jgi:hypothetical protein